MLPFVASLRTPKLAAPRLSRLAIAAWAATPLLAGAQSGNDLIWLKGGHASTVNTVAWAPDGSLLATASDDSTVKLWSTNGSLVRTLTTHPYQATALAFSPDGTKLAVGTYSGGYYYSSNCLGRVQLWQATNGWTGSNVAILRTTTNKFGKITAVAFSPDGAKLASCTSGGSNYVHQVSNGALLTAKSVYTTNRLINLETNAAALALAFSTGGFLASGCEDGTIRVWTSTWAQVWNNNTAHSSNVTAVAFSPNGSTLASASLDQTVRLWTATNWTSLGTLLGHTSGVNSISFSPDSRTLASGSTDGSIKLWDLAGFTCLTTFWAHADAVLSVAISPDGTRLASGGADNNARLWLLERGILSQKLGDHTDLIKAIAISPDGTLCATAANDQSIQVRRLVDGMLLRTLPGHTGCVSSVAFALDSAVLASGGGPLDPALKLWRVNDGALLRTIAANSNGVMALAFSPDGATLAAGGDFDEHTIRLWNAGDGTLLRTLAGHSNGVTTLAFSPRGDRLVSGGRKFDHTVKVWAVSNGTLNRTFTGHSNHIEAVALGEDGDTVASGSSGTNALKVWQISDGTSRNFGSDTNTVFFVAFSPDGGTLASAGRDAIKLWNVASGSLSRTITQETFRVSCLAYSLNGNLFAFGREDATLAAATNGPGALGRPPLSFTGIATSPGGSTAVQAAVQPKTRYLIQASTNMTDWSYLTIAVSDTNWVQFADDSTNSAPPRFYRAMTPP
jgi:WD40 repeat protein